MVTNSQLKALQYAMHHGPWGDEEHLMAEALHSYPEVFHALHEEDAEEVIRYAHDVLKNNGHGGIPYLQSIGRYCGPELDEGVEGKCVDLWEDEDDLPKAPSLHSIGFTAPSYPSDFFEEPTIEYMSEADHDAVKYNDSNGNQYVSVSAKPGHNYAYIYSDGEVKCVEDPPMPAEPDDAPDEAPVADIARHSMPKSVRDKLEADLNQVELELKQRQFEHEKSMQEMRQQMAQDRAMHEMMKNSGMLKTITSGFSKFKKKRR